VNYLGGNNWNSGDWYYGEKGPCEPTAHDLWSTDEVPTWWKKNPDQGEEQKWRLYVELWECCGSSSDNIIALAFSGW
jgi:hypothetical protein